ncbi:crossover junction endonuclease EME1 [Drosophila ficusphila]|uniref:crossover junction endonuclease EME1 n=1 Tax=Drosophila ficusphila TaxID=30025 RepID=UPI0007E7E1C9|nr:crossover junction endonuclease EME1 [Drosophila ficusphila]
MSNKVDKLHKQALREQQKRIKPGECMKYVRMVIDSGFLSIPEGQEMLQQLNSSDLKYEIKSLPVSYCILWERNVGQQTISLGTSPTGLDEAWKRENQVVQFLPESSFHKALKDQSLVCLGPRLQDSFPDCQYTVAVPKPRHGKHNASSHQDALIEMQLLQELHVEQLNRPEGQDLLALLRRYTKAIAEAPYKKQRNESLGCFKKYLANDKKQCVRVDQGNGYGRLWQQHLNRLPQVTLEVAESVIAQYPCPKNLLDHFANDPNAVQNLADLKIKRCNGPQPLHTERRIGNVLSNKLHTLYNARDPNTLL